MPVRQLPFFAFTLVALGLSPLILTPYMVVASFAFAFMAWGYSVRRTHNQLHRVLMASAISLDVILVLVLQIQRNAIQTAMSFTLSLLQQLHIGASTLALLLYFPIVFLAVRSIFGSATANQKIWHKRLGHLAFIFRALGFLLMFSLLVEKP